MTPHFLQEALNPSDPSCADADSTQAATLFSFSYIFSFTEVFVAGL